MLEQGKLADAFQHADQGEAMLNQIGIRGWDLSHLEILISRARILRNKRDEGVARLLNALSEYADREVLCHLKIKCELARVLKSTDRNEARRHAKEVYEKASAIGARPLAERADSLLHRL
jgi:hypothetical protein